LTYDVSDNALDGEVPDMCGAPGIRYLYLHKNKLNGALPDLSCMTDLYEVNVSENGLTSLEGDWLGGSPKLQHFNAERNQLTGAPPSSLCGTFSKTLYLGHNAWRGSVPESIGDCPGLEVLDLTVDEASVDDGSAAGTMPSSAAFAKLTKLTTLALSVSIFLFLLRQLE
jgi:Leucine-rich repeat (LRR) protein